MAIAKTISIHHTQGIRNLAHYIEDPEKSVLPDDAILREADYGRNPEKTTYDGRQLVSGYLCDPRHISEDFARARHLYESSHLSKAPSGSKKPVCAIHIVMSFPEVPNLDPLLVHQIGMEFCSRLKDKGLGDYQALVSTHVNTDHLHNHILLNAFSMDGSRKYHANLNSLHLLRELNDELSLKYGLPILEEIDRDQAPYTAYSEAIGEHYARAQNRSWKEQFRKDMDRVLLSARSVSDFTARLESEGYDLRRSQDGRILSIAKDGHRIRIARLGENYTYDALIARIAAQSGISLQSRATNHNAKRQDKQDSRNRHTESSDSHYGDNKAFEDRHAAESSDIGKVLYGRSVLRPEYVSRYSDSGRRRSDLEYLLLRARAWLRYIAAVMREAGAESKAQSAEKQTADLEKALEIAATLHVEHISDVPARLKETGREISSEKKNVLELRSLSERLKSDAPDKLTASDIPMTTRQRKELYEASCTCRRRPGRRYDDIDFLSAQEMIDWVNAGGSGPEPRLLAKRSVQKDRCTENHLTGKGKEEACPSDFPAGESSSRPLSTEELRQMAEKTDAMLHDAQQRLLELNSQYKDLKFLRKNIRSAETIRPDTPDAESPVNADDFRSGHGKETYDMNKE